MNSNSFGFDQFQPSQSPVIHQPPQETSEEILRAKENLMNSIETFLKKFNHISFRETLKVLMQAWDKFFEVKHAQSEEVQEVLNKLLEDVRNVNEELAEYINTPSWNLPTSSYDDDNDDVENLVQNPRESEDECECDVPDCDDSQTTNFSTFSNPLFDDSTSSDDESSHEEIDSLFDEFTGELITIPPRIVREKEYISMMEREEINIFPGPDDSIPPGIKSDDYDSEGDDNSTSLLEFESFHVDYLDSGDSTIDMVEDIPVDVPNIFPTHPTLHMDFDFILSRNDLGSDLDVSSPSGDRNKIYDPGICIKVESTRLLATHSPVIDTLLPFSSKNKDKDCPDFEASRARGFVLRSLELHILSFILGIQYPNLID
ncbi:hypothetical protein Tco_0596904 [Tanacetum coccineum]